MPEVWRACLLGGTMSLRAAESLVLVLNVLLLILGACLVLA